MKIFLCIIAVVSLQGVVAFHVEREYAWKNITYEGIDPASYNIENSIPTAFAHDAASKKIFITVPRRNQIPFTLTELDTTKHPERSPPLSKFPGSDKLISVYQPVIDECRRLWIADVGQVEYKGDEQKYPKQKAAIIAYDLTKDNYPEIDRYEIPNNVAGNSLGFGGFAVDVTNPKEGCGNTFVYITNFEDNTLIVYDQEKKDSWKISHGSFKPEHDSTLSHNGEQYKYRVGIFGIALGDRDPEGNRPAYYIAGSSTKLFEISTKILKQKGAKFDPVNLGNRGPHSEAIALAYDPKTKVIFFAEADSRQISCWNIQKPLNHKNTDVIYASSKFIFGTDISVDSESQLWFLSNGQPPIDNLKLTFDKPHIRLMRVDTAKAIRRTKCEVKRVKP
uniref:Yellow-related salivary protein ASP4 n=1 Tax=Phlebotomus orientalis TaxID=99786 RepID=ASP4_PHLOR|nr:yellow-related salivary protein [Phlebotomus orientalis]AGT96461.1 yellow-related salivary protein [Phlebotomus orientalis]